MVTRIRIVKDETWRFVEGINNWLKVDENIDWLLPRAGGVVFAVAFLALIITLFFL